MIWNLHRYTNKIRIFAKVMVFLLPVVSYAQLFYYDRQPYNDANTKFDMFDEAWAIRDSLWEADFEVRFMYIFEIEEIPYLVLDGRFDLFEWVDSKWINRYQGSFHGYNFASKKFVFNGEIYSFGGYGFWRNHGDLIKFLWDKNEWEIIQIHVKTALGNGIAYEQDSMLYIINPLQYFDGTAAFKKKIKSKKLDLINKRISNFRHADIDNSTTHENILPLYIETQNFIVIIGKPFYILNKNTSNLYQYELSVFDGLIYANYVRMQHAFEIQGDQIYLWDKQHNLYEKYDVNSEVQKFSKVPLIDSWALVIQVFLFCVFLAVFIYSMRKWKRMQKEKGKDSLEEFHTFKPYFSSVISQQKIDELLQIDSITSAETLRYKRSQRINEINLKYQSKTGRNLIDRVKDPSDKRRILYQID